MFNKEKALKVLEELYSRHLRMDYYRLMAKHGRVLKYGLRFGGSEEVREKVLEIKRRAVKNSIKKLAKNESVRGEYIKANYPALYDSLRYIYHANGKLGRWEQALKETGVSSEKNRTWNLKMLLDKLNELGDDPASFRYTQLYEKDSSLTMEARKYFGKYGKAVMLVGVDYLLLPKIYKREEYYFTNKDFQLILGDEDLSGEEKVRAIFYGLTFQYFPMQTYKSYCGRRIDNSCDKGFSIYSDKEHFWALNVRNYRDSQSTRQRVSFELDKGLKAKFHRADFCFEGYSAEAEALRFRCSIEDLLRV